MISLGEMEGLQNNVQASRNISVDQDILGRGKRPQRPKYNDEEYDMSIISEGEFETGHSSRGHTATRSRGRGGRRADQGGEPRNMQPAPTANGRGRGGRTSKLRSDTATSAANAQIESGIEIESENDELDTIADLQFEEVSDKLKSVNETSEWYADNAYAMLEALVQVLPQEAINGLNKYAKDNEESERHTWLQNCMAAVARRKYIEVVSQPVSAVSENSVTRTNANENEARNQRATTALPASARQILESEAATIVMEKLEDKMRKRNIIIIGMEEGLDDMELTRGMFMQMGCEQVIQDIDSNPTRLGTGRIGRNRPLKIEFRAERAVNFVIANKKELMWSNNYYNVYINRDLCKQERERERNSRRGVARNNNYRNMENSAGGEGRGSAVALNLPDDNVLQNNMNNEQQSDQSQNEGRARPDLATPQRTETDTSQVVESGGAGMEESGGGSNNNNDGEGEGEGGGGEGIFGRVVNSAVIGIRNITAAITPRRQGIRDTVRSARSSENPEAVRAPETGTSTNVSGNRGGRGEELVE